MGFASIILGDVDHPEVAGLLGYADREGYVVGRLRDLEALPIFDRAIVVAQTTQNVRLFEEVKRWVGGNASHYKVFNTICDSTARRQAEVKRLTETVDALVVVGGRSSGNTTRLAEIGHESGKPTYHVETEAELEALPLDAARHIGVTAGASTPNWIINRVFRTIEKIPFKRGQPWRKAVYVAQRALLLTNIYVALGAASLCFACATLLGASSFRPYVSIAMAYVLSMHMLNNLIGSKADWYNDPGRAYFYEKYKVVLTVMAVTAGGFGLVTAIAMGPVAFLLLLVMSGLGLSYNMKLVPFPSGRRKWNRLRDIPGSKTVLIALAWGVVTALFPALAASGEISSTTLLVFLWSTALVFVRTAFFDILDMQGDRIVGKNTIPLVFGGRQTMTFLKTLLVALLFIFTLAAAFQWIPSLAVALAACPLFLLLTLLAQDYKLPLSGIRVEFIVESQFVLAGGIAWIWSMLVA
jgi:4-hydroxy-3-methylbut-2-enyl diphosphate reductase